jgi:hypothetical protein
MRFLSVIACAAFAIALGAVASPASAACGEFGQIQLHWSNLGVRINWSATINSECSDHLVYIERQCNNGEWTTIGSVAASVFTFLDSNKCPDKGTYRLRMVCDCGDVFSRDIGPVCQGDPDIPLTMPY